MAVAPTTAIMRVAEAAATATAAAVTVGWRRRPHRRSRMSTCTCPWDQAARLGRGGGGGISEGGGGQAVVRVELLVALIVNDDRRLVVIARGGRSRSPGSSSVESDPMLPASCLPRRLQLHLDLLPDDIGRADDGHMEEPVLRRPLAAGEARARSRRGC